MTDSLLYMQIGRGCVVRHNMTARWGDQPSQFAWDLGVFRAGVKDITGEVLDKLG